jgi:acetate kinase
MIIVTVNSGSTSTKIAAFDAPPGAAPDVAVSDGEKLSPIAHEQYAGAMEPGEALAAFGRALAGRRIQAVAHRVVHGGMRFTAPVRIDAAVESLLDELSELAPLHNPVAVRWIRAARAHFGPKVVHVAAFDTAFFARLPRISAEYALPASLGTALGVRRYGFHGLAHEAMWRRWRDRYPRIERPRIITLQLGGGCSAAAIRDGHPIDTSMGFSPLEGLVMATRSGDLDASVVPYLARRLGCTGDEIVERLNREAGLLGLSGNTSEMSRLAADASPEAQLAVDMYCYRARKYVGAYLAALGGCDGIIFGGGVGEHVPQVRARILCDMAWAGIALDPRANECARRGEARIGAAQSRVAIDVIPPDEDHALVEAAVGLMASRG